MIFKRISNLRRSLASRLIVTVGLTLLVTFSTWAFFNVDYQEKKLMDNIVVATDRLTNTIKLGTHYAMMLNSRDDINQIITNISRQKEIETIRIYNKEGRIKYSNQASELERSTNIKAEACDICHKTDPPPAQLEVSERVRILDSSEGHRLLGIISPICNEPGCATDICHVHPVDKKILGALDVVVSLADTDREILTTEKGIIRLAGIVCAITSAIIFVFVLRFVNKPVRGLIHGTRLIARGEDPGGMAVDQDDEMGQLAVAINQMSREISKKQAELNKQKDEYQNLFEQVPCLVTVQDRNFKLLRYNAEFARNFGPERGDFCYHAYKGRSEKCVACPVEKTFQDGKSYYGEESGVNRDGTLAHWILRTSPLKNEQGDIVAAMEMSLDITERKQLEDKLEKSEKKYYEIFNNIPNPVFVLDNDTLEILDCNDSMQIVYGYRKNEIISRSFLDLFLEEDRHHYAKMIKENSVINQVKQLNSERLQLTVNIRISPAEYPGKKVLLVTTSDITKRLETEQQLIQASKMATLGEMATGIAHELNQPLSVIKTASSFFVKKIDHKEAIEDAILFKMLNKIDTNVDRATRIINHMRQFARKSDMDFEGLQVNDVLQSAFDIFSQQLKVRGIRVIWNIEKNLPRINADAGRLEQVFINLLLNSRDAIEEKWGHPEAGAADKRIILETKFDNPWVVCTVCDTGTGISPAIADKIFDPFFTTKQVGKGTGLGLSISYGIIKDCGGSIQVTLHESGGACFTIKFAALEMNHGK